MTRKLWIVVVLAALLLALPLASQAAEVAWDSDCLAFQSGARPHDWRWQSDELPNCLHGTISHYKCKNCGNTTTKYGTDKTDHKWGEWQRQTDPTCTAPGKDIHFCTVCLNASQTRDVAALGHQWDSGTVTKEPTCTAEGVRTFHCTRVQADGGLCSGTKTEPIPALGHSMGEWKTVKEATCTAKGTQERVCTRCGGAKETRSIKAAGHKPVTVPGKAATCTAPGKTDGSKCSVCGKELTAQSDIPALGHNWGAWVEFTPGTCVKKQVLQRKCTRCGEVDWWTKDYGDHDWGEWTVVKEPTATEDGLRERVCKLDASHKEQEAIPATGEPADEAKYVLKGFEEHYPGLDSGYFPDFSGSRKVIWEGSEPEFYYVGVSVLYRTPEHYYALDSDPVPGEVYYFRAMINNEIYGDHSIDFSQVDPAQVIVTMEGFTVEFLRSEPVYISGGQDRADLFFKATYVGGDDDAPHPALHLEITWDENAGEGKRYEGAVVPLYWKITNTGDCPVYQHPSKYVDCTDFIWPNGITYVPGLGYEAAVINPGESWTMTCNHVVSLYQESIARIHLSYGTRASWIDTDGTEKKVYSNGAIVDIPLTYLTYSDGTTPEEDKPAIKLTVVQITPEKEAYVDVKDWTPENFIRVSVTYTNIGNVPLRFELYTYQGAKERAYPTWYEREKILNPGESWSIPQKPYSGYYICDVHGYLPPDSEEYAGIFPFRFKVFGYAVDDTKYTTPICESNSVTFKHNIAKPGPAEWEIPEQSQLEVEVFTDSAFEAHAEEFLYGSSSSDPAGYQYGEVWSTSIRVANTGPVDVDACTVHEDVTADIGWNIADQTYGTIEAGTEFVENVWSPYGMITEADVARGYIEVTAQAKWTDPDSGKNRTADSNVWHQPVISKTGLLLKKGAKAPANGAYFVEGEAINWTLEATNNSKEELTDVTVTDNGATVGTFPSLAAMETQPVTVPPHTVTAYEAQVVGHVTNYAMATGKNLAGVEHTWTSNPVTVLTGQPITPPEDGGGEDPLGPTYGVHPAVSITKTDTFGPPDGESYKLGEEAIFTITVTNTGDCALEGLQLYDSLAGFSPIGSLASLAPGASHSFAYKHTVTQPNVDHGYVINSATLTYSFAGVPGTPMSSNECKILCGELGDTLITDPIPPFDPEILQGFGSGEDACSLTLNIHAGSEAHYTLHACADHTEAARSAEEAGLAGDWKTAAQIWRGQVDALYEVLYAAASDEAKAVLLTERTRYYAWVDALAAMSGDQAAAEALRLKCAQLCFVVHNPGEALPDSLLDSAVGLTKQAAPAAEQNSRVFGALNGTDAEVTETYAPGPARATANVMALMREARSYNADDVFRRGQVFWQTALDDTVNPAYLAADKEARTRIAAWRIGLDTLRSAESPFLALLFPENNATVEECLMNLYRDGIFQLEAK